MQRASAAADAHSDLRRTPLQAELLADEPELREDYMLRYMLNIESRGSASLLNIACFERPFDYRLEIATGSAGETRPVAVDLVETFNYLLGLRVQRIESSPASKSCAGVQLTTNKR